VLAINLDIGDVVLENGGDVDLMAGNVSLKRTMIRTDPSTQVSEIIISKNQAR
jgi:hypothetical protein